MASHVQHSFASLTSNAMSEAESADSSTSRASALSGNASLQPGGELLSRASDRKTEDNEKPESTPHSHKTASDTSSSTNSTSNIAIHGLSIEWEHDEEPQDGTVNNQKPRLIE
jgi:hypothetical protein